MGKDNENNKDNAILLSNMREIREHCLKTNCLNCRMDMDPGHFSCFFQQGSRPADWVDAVLNMPVVRTDKENRFINYYECPCGKTWNMEWSCCCDDKCPACGKEIEPYQSVDTVLPDNLKERMIRNQEQHEEAHEKDEALFYEFLKSVGIDEHIKIMDEKEAQRIRRVLRLYIPGDSITKMWWFCAAMARGDQVRFEKAAVKASLQVMEGLSDVQNKKGN